MKLLNLLREITAASCTEETLEFGKVVSLCDGREPIIKNASLKHSQAAIFSVRPDISGCW